MKVKNLSMQDAIQQLQNLYKTTNFNNELNKAVRKKIKQEPDIIKVKDQETGELRRINGWWDSPNQKMIEFIENIVKEQTWMSEAIKRSYIKQSGRIFAGIYSIATNTYLHKDIKDLENYINMLNETKNGQKDEESINGATITRENGRLNIDFGGKVDKDVYKILRSNGFLYSPRFEQFTRQHTPNAEYSLENVIRALKEREANL